MVETREIRLPITDVLVIETINHVFAQDEVRPLHIRLAVEQTRGDQVCLVDRATLVTPARRGQHLVAQPPQVGLELCQHFGGGEIPRERLVAMKQKPGILLHHDVNGIQQALQVALLDERAPRYGIMKSPTNITT